MRSAQFVGIGENAGEAKISATDHMHVLPAIVEEGKDVGRGSRVLGR